MCSNPQTHDGLTFACRVCNDCIAARKNDWVARCMAEKASMGNALVITLTYRDNPDGTKPQGATAFQYSHVQNFLKRLREWYFEEYNTRGEISYLVAGEIGSKGTKRVHWHLVIFSKRPILPAGKWWDKYMKPLKSFRDLVFGKKNRYHWSLWEHGHINILEPDQRGMAYVVKYALKDMFNVVKSQNTMRQSKSENHGASYFRMSKLPPIGMRFLIEKCERWEELGAVPPNLHLKVPNYSGFWWPKGTCRAYLLQRLHDINETTKEKHGRECPQWSTLLSTVSDSEKDWEALFYGDWEDEETRREVEKDLFEKSIEEGRTGRSSEEILYRERLEDIRGECGGGKVCRKCWQNLDANGKLAYRLWYVNQEALHSEYRGGFDAWHLSQGRVNPYCEKRREIDHVNAFIARKFVDT